MPISSTQMPLLTRLYARLLHALPLAGGLTKLSFNPLAKLLFRNITGSVEATMLNGIRIEVDGNDYHGRILYLFGTNDPKVQTTAQSLLRPGDLFLDIGANYSSIGLQVASVVGESGKVHLFEPQPDLCRRVTAAIEKAGLRNVMLHNVGLMDRDGELELARPKNHSGMASFNPQFDSEKWQRQVVPIREISAYLGPLVADKPFGVKIDVEGVEPVLLPWLLSQPNLRFLIFEAAHNHADLWRMIHDEHGFKMYGLERRVFARNLVLIPEQAGMCTFHDIVAVSWRKSEPPPDQAHPHRLGALLSGRTES